jgi:hypothetical protein
MELIAVDSKENFETWINRDFITPELRLILSKASILIVPFEDLREELPPVFPTMTTEILQYFKSNLPSEITIDICIEDEEYNEFAFNTDYKRLGKFVVKKLALPIFAGLMLAYITENFINKDDLKPITVVAPTTNIITINQTPPTNAHSNELPVKRIIPDKKYMEPTHVKFSVTLTDSLKTSKEIKFEGPAKEVAPFLEALKKYEE